LQNLFGFIIYPMELGVVWLTLTVGGAGLGIILFTIIVRLVLAPLNIAQLRNARAMQRLQPHMQAIRKKHSQDRVKQTEELQALYKEHGVNPALGCLPMVLQLPILFGLFYALMHLGSAPSGYPHQTIEWAKSACNGHAVSTWHQWFQTCYSVKNMPGHPQEVWNLFHAKFLWLRNGLGQPDPLYILPLLAGATQWIQSRMMLTRSSDPQQQMMNSMMNFMPLMIIFFASRYASGLSLYWVTSTTIGILIQYPITGWGLLPVPWRRDDGPSGSGAKLKGAKPAPSLGIAPANEADTNGTNGTSGDTGNGTTGDSKTVATPRTRRKANRARGGRGGRRG
jgi:YidC/Oxa1 family membrane protein insertase